LGRSAIGHGKQQGGWTQVRGPPLVRRLRQRTHLGYGGRRVLVSRKWSGKTLAQHKQDRRTWVAELLGVDLKHNDTTAYVWQLAHPTDSDVPPITHRLMTAVAQRATWRQQLDTAQAAPPPTPDHSAIERAAA
jgi:hypothetical protein